MSPTPSSGSYSNPPIVSFDALNLIISSSTSSYTDADVYSLRVTGGYTVLNTISAYEDFDLYVIAPIKTNPISSITYVVGDTTYNHIFT